MKKMLATLTLLLALASLSFAHGNAKHLMGTVTAVSPDSITVKTTKGVTTMVTFTPETKFAKSGAPATAKDLKTGDRVVIEGDDDNGRLRAESVRFGKMTKKSMQGMSNMSNMPGMKH